MERGNVFDELRREILDLTLKPGTELNLNQLSTKYGVSRSPVRDAVKELAGEHLIDIYPQRGTYVSRINLRMAEDERFIRLNLELGSIPDFINNVNDDLISEMEELIEKQEKAFALRDTSLLLKLDDQFHSVIFKGAGREGVFDFILTRNGNYHRMRLISFMFDAISEDVIRQHRVLLDAIKDKDMESLFSLDRAHMTKLKKETVSFRETMPQYFLDK
ncbi:MAG: GntR family transcriptional regulator [Spirochaetales bacterium]|nr:GntR family transcriptional regulator [Spirochaetales bacterium]